MKNRAIEDPEVRAAIWATVCLAAEQLHSCAVLLPSVKKAKPQEISNNSPVPSFKTWRLVEALSLLGILLRADSVQTKAVKLFARTGPVEFVEDGEPRFLWVQQGAEAELSGLVGRPDSFCHLHSGTSDGWQHCPSRRRKFVKSFGAADLRAEFGKGYDLRVRSYFIWTYYTPSPAMAAGAVGLRIDLQGLGFDTNRQQDLIEQPAALLSKVAHALEESRKAERFAARCRTSQRGDTPETPWARRIVRLMRKTGPALPAPGTLVRYRETTNLLVPYRTRLRS